MTLGSCPIEDGEEFGFNFEYKISENASIPIVRLSLKKDRHLFKLWFLIFRDTLMES